MSRAPLGMIAGQGALPLRIAEAQVAAGREVFIIGVTKTRLATLCKQVPQFGSMMERVTSWTFRQLCFPW